MAINGSKIMLCDHLLGNGTQRGRLLIVAQAMELISEGASITCSDSNRFIYVNPSWQRIYGYCIEEVLGKKPTRLLNIRRAATTIQSILKNTLKGGWKGKITSRDRDGQKFDVNLSTTALLDEDDKLLGLLSIYSPVKNGNGRNRNDVLMLPVEKLTVRERDVFKLIGKGKSTEQIGSQLGISIFTVQTFRNHIKRKLGFRTAVALTHGACQWRSRH